MKEATTTLTRAAIQTLWPTPKWTQAAITTRERLSHRALLPVIPVGS